MEINIDYTDKDPTYFNNIRHEMFPYAPKNAKVILDVGCGNGIFAECFKTRENAEVWGIEYVDHEARSAAEKLDKVFSGPCEDYLDELPEDYFDVIYFNDVLEHLIDPYTVLKKIKSKLKLGGVVISSIPNVRYFKPFMRVLFGKDWKYSDHGTMDRTHMRFFTKKSILRMYLEAGYKVLTHEGINKTKSITPILFNIPMFFTQMDMLNLQYATVAARV